MKKLLPIMFVLFMAAAAYSQTAIVLRDKTNLQATPVEKGKSLKVLGGGTEVRVIRQKGPWYMVRSSRTVGWLHGNAITFHALKEMRLDRMTKVGEIDSNGDFRLVTSGGEGGLTGSENAPVRPPGKPLPKMISGGVLNGKATSLMKPVYPAAARAVHASGAVSVQVVIDETGRVISAAAVSGHPLLRAAAVSAAEGSRFSPTLLMGQPVKVSGVITYNFLP